jgi:30S ribosomal protein S31
MGKGDKRTRRGKLFNRSYGKSRPHDKKAGAPKKSYPKKATGSAAKASPAKSPTAKSTAAKTKAAAK